MTDVYLWDETYDPQDVVLRTSAAVTTTTTTNPAGGLRAHGFTQRKALTGSGHLHVEFVLHGDGAVPVLTGEPGPLRSAGNLTPAFAATHRLRSTVGIVHTSCRVRSASTLAPVVHLEHTRTVDPDEWLLLDIPELA